MKTTALPLVLCAFLLSKVRGKQELKAPRPQGSIRSGWNQATISSRAIEAATRTVSDPQRLTANTAICSTSTRVPPGGAKKAIYFDNEGPGPA
jgi:hypothetical protein